MTDGERLFVRVDATLATGLGHFYRCLAIAQCWRETVGPVTVIGQCPDTLRSELAAENVDHEAMPAPCPEPQDIERTIALVPDGAPVIVDGYHFDSAYLERLAKNRPLLVIDDIGHLDSYSGSYLLNANVYAESVDYAGAPAQRLLGLRYALLRRRFRRARAERRRADDPVETLLICLGGADAANDTLRILQALAKTSLPLARVRVVVGPLNPHVDSLAGYAERDARIEICRNPRDMCAELLAADFVIAGAGTISAELAYLGKPSLLFAVADNQLATGPLMEQAGAAIYAGDVRVLDFEQLVAKIAAAISDTRRHESMRAIGPALVDGEGAVRICRILSGAPHG